VWVHAPDAARDATGRNASPPLVSSNAALHAAAPPLLELQGLVAGLRVGSGLWVLGACDAPYLPFEVEVGSVLGAERRARVSFSPSLAEQALQPFGGVARAWSSANAELIARLSQLNAKSTADTSAQWLALSAHDPLELSLLLPPAGFGLHADSGALRFYPLGELGPAAPPRIARWSLPAGERAALSRVQLQPLHARLSLQPDPVRGDAPVRAQARADRALAAVALRFDHRHTAFGLAPAEHRYRALGAHHVQGVALADDGAPALLDAQVTVATARMSSAGSCAASSGRAGLVSAGLGLWAAALLLKRRRQLRAGNRLGPDPRSARSERHP
jgi:hypothetical protein